MQPRGPYELTTEHPVAAHDDRPLWRELIAFILVVFILVGRGGVR